MSDKSPEIRFENYIAGAYGAYIVVAGITVFIVIYRRGQIR